MVYDTLYLTLLYRGLRDRSRSIFGVLTSFKKKSTSFCKNFFSKKIILILFFFFFNFFSINRKREFTGMEHPHDSPVNPGFEVRI